LKCGSPRRIIHRSKKSLRERSHDAIKHDSEKKGKGGFREALGKEELVNRMYPIIKMGKQGLDGFVQELGALPVEAIMDMERDWRRCYGGFLHGSIKRPCWRRVKLLGYHPVRYPGSWWR